MTFSKDEIQVGLYIIAAIIAFVVIYVWRNTIEASEGRKPTFPMWLVILCGALLLIAGINVLITLWAAGWFVINFADGTYIIPESSKTLKKIETFLKKRI
jgi:uncharacterized membrane protein